MQNDVMADHAVVADCHWKSRISVQRGIVLDLRPLAELDPFIVAAQDRAKPDARLRFEPHASDQNRSIRNVVLTIGGKFRAPVRQVDRLAFASPCANLPQQR